MVMLIKNPHTFNTIELDELLPLAQKKMDEGGRFVNLHACTVEDGFELTYSFTDDETVIDNYRINIHEDDVVPAISPIWLAAFVFENEIHDLFGINIDGIAIDFGGNFYQIALDRPMRNATTDDDMFSVARKEGALSTNIAELADDEGGEQ